MIEFKGNWKIDIKLNHLCGLNSDKFFGFDSQKEHKERLKKGLVSILIEDVRDFNPDPLHEQINTIDWITDNQVAIKLSLYDYVKNTIIPYYFEHWNDDKSEYRYPKLNSIDDLNKAIGLRSITIHKFHKENQSFYTLYFAFSTDEEHGLAITLHKTSLISFNAIGDQDYKGIIEDLGLNYETWEQDYFKSQSEKELIYHKPIQKYNKLKPWQIEENDYYPYGLFHNKRDDELIDFLENEDISVDGDLVSFLELAIRTDREPIVQYCLTKSPKKLHQPFMEALKKDRFDLLDKLIELGYSVNKHIAQDSPLFEQIGEFEKALLRKDDPKIVIKRINFLFSRGLNPFLEDRFGRNSFYRMKRIEDDKIKMEISEYFNKRRKKKPKWKFW
jgi:hypothetical protein